MQQLAHLLAELLDLRDERDVVGAERAGACDVALAHRLHALDVSVVARRSLAGGVEQQVGDALHRREDGAYAFVVLSVFDGVYDAGDTLGIGGRAPAEFHYLHRRTPGADFMRNS